MATANLRAGKKKRRKKRLVMGASFKPLLSKCPEQKTEAKKSKKNVYVSYLTEGRKRGYAAEKKQSIYKRKGK